MATFELINIDQQTGEEDLLATGTMDAMIEAMEDTAQQAEDDGYDQPWMRIQAAIEG